LDFTQADTISGHLKIVDLDDAQNSHNAVSYVWGSATQSHIVHINGHELVIRSNLYNFLRTYKSHNIRRLPLWIDQICINQNDKREKETQIGFMGQIYARSSETLIWLGLDPDNGAAFTCFKEFDVFSARSDVHHGAREVWLDELCEDENSPLYAFFNLPYWRRQWVAQELCLSSAPVLLFGTEMLPWTLFENLAMRLPFRSNLFTRPRNSSWRKLIKLRQTVLESKRADTGNEITTGIIHDDDVRTWLVAMNFTYDSLCETPCDKVYGIQAIFSKHRQISVDYTRSVQDLYLASVQKWFEAARGHADGMRWYMTGCVKLAVGMHMVDKSNDLLGEVMDRFHDRWPLDSLDYRVSAWNDVRHFLEANVLRNLACDLVQQSSGPELLT
jgi:hypothetical protein